MLRYHLQLLLSMSIIQYSRSTGTQDLLQGLGVPNFPFRRTFSQLALAVLFGSSAWSLLEIGFTILSINTCILTRSVRALPFVPPGWEPDPFDPRLWPPLLRSPLQSDSLADFWTYRWHRCEHPAVLFDAFASMCALRADADDVLMNRSILRRYFIVMGYWPARFITSWAGRQTCEAAGVIGAFLASGALHEIGEQFEASQMR